MTNMKEIITSPVPKQFKDNDSSGKFSRPKHRNGAVLMKFITKETWKGLRKFDETFPKFQRKSADNSSFSVS